MSCFPSLPCHSSLVARPSSYHILRHELRFYTIIRQHKISKDDQLWPISSLPLQILSFAYRLSSLNDDYFGVVSCRQLAANLSLSPSCFLSSSPSHCSTLPLQQQLDSENKCTLPKSQDIVLPRVILVLGQLCLGKTNPKDIIAKRMTKKLT